jgi:hypothetical protein
MSQNNKARKNPRRLILEETAEILDGPRNRDYGDAKEDFTTTAAFWNNYLQRISQRRGGLELTSHDVAALMMLLKLARLTWTPNVKDHWMDAIGYAALGWECSVSDVEEKNSKRK